MLYLIILSILAFSLNSVCTRLVQTKLDRSGRLIALYQFLFCLTAAILFFVSAEKQLPSIETLICGCLFGVFFFGAVFFSAIGFTRGSMALTSVIVNMSLLLPLAYSIVFFNEQLHLGHIVGILLFLATFVLATATGEKQQKHIDGLGMAVIMTAFFCNGLTAVIQKDYVMRAESNQTRLLMCIAYFTAALLFAVQFFIKLLRSASNTTPIRQSRCFFRLCLLSVLSGLGSYGGNLLLTDLSARVEGTILYPCVNGGICLLLTVISLSAFHEKASVKKLAAVTLGIIAIVILNFA